MTIKKIVATILISMSIVISSQAVMVMNNVIDPLPPGKAKTAIAENVVQGAEHFLKGNAYALLAMSVYENTIFDSDAFKSYLEKAINEMALAKRYYSDAYSTVSSIALLIEKQAISNSYDYEALAYKFSNRAIFNDVIEFFRDYNIAGIHKKNLENVDNILSAMTSIAAQEKPDVQAMWTLFANLNSAAQFGNYATQVAYTIYK